MITESAPGRLKLLRDSASGVGGVGGRGKAVRGLAPSPVGYEFTARVFKEC